MKIVKGEHNINMFSDRDKLIASLSYNLNGNKAEVISCGSKQKRKGYTTELFNEFEDFCREKGIKTIGLTVGQDNIPARNLYEKRGFAYSRNEDALMQQRRRLNMVKKL